MGNLDANIPVAAEGRAFLDVFDWNSVEDLKRIQAAGPWDAIVGSDLVYPGNAGRKCVPSNEERHPADETLLSLFQSLATDQTMVILALKDRTGEVPRFIENVNRSVWNLSQAPAESVMPEFRKVEAIAVLKLRLRPEKALSMSDESRQVEGGGVDHIFRPLEEA